MKAANIFRTQESSCVEITNEDNAHHFPWYQGYCSLWIFSARPSNQPTLPYGNIGVVTWNCA